jgi:hypothetical protein
MKINHFYIAVLGLALIYQAAWAFQDIYESDDGFEQATSLRVDDEKRQQHTLHNQEDEDWFKFYAAKGIKYEIIAYSVGADIDVVLELYGSDGETKLERINDDSQGEQESFSWRMQSEGWYFIKVSSFETESKTCRSELQYELRVKKGIAQTFSGAVQGFVKDALSGKPVVEAIVYSECPKGKSEPVPSGEDGYYDLDSHADFCDLIINVDDGSYKPLRCHIQISEGFPTPKDISLLPNGQLPPAPLPSQLVYHNGDILHVEFQASLLPLQSCVRYHFAIVYPDGQFFIISKKDELEEFNPPSLAHWEDAGNVLIDKPISDDMPRGDYQLHILRMPEGITDPLNNLDKGELNVGQFRVE